MLSYNAPNYLLVRAAGNDRNEGPTPGSYNYAYINGQWRLTNTIRNVDGGSDGYDCLSYASVAKNPLVVGAINTIPNGYTTPGSAIMSTFSSWGPTDDGRIKPDLVGAGVSILSSNSTNDASYSTASGTSMSSPSVCGSLALVQQFAKETKGSYVKAATLKAIAIHTANDAGNPGPDYAFGWGVLNVPGCIKLIENENKLNQIIETNLANGTEYKMQVYVSGIENLKATVSWTDPAGAVLPLINDNRQSMLVNDLDIRIVRNADQNISLPYKLNPAVPAAFATLGDNLVDNVEQINLSNPIPGFYTIIVKHKGNLLNNSQPKCCSKA